MITLLQLKTFLKIASAETSQDTLLGDLKTRALRELNTLCNRRFDYGTYIDEVMGNGKDSIYLRNFPLHSITSVEQYNINGDYEYATIFTGTDTIDNSSILTADIGCLMLTKGYGFNSGYRYRITYVAGYVAGANDWVTATVYIAGDYVRFNNRLYKCLLGHTAGTFATDLAALKWELSTDSLAPEDLQNVQIYLAAKFYYESPAGRDLFMKQSANIGSQVSESAQYKDIDIQKTIDAYRNINV